MLANRISWFFDLTGPSITLDSACSSSLMALDFACQGLRCEDTNMVNIPP
jgi:acyl transferase domain-containing protein